MSKQKMREALEYVHAYIEECDGWDNKEPLLRDIQKALAAPAAPELTDAEINEAAGWSVSSAFREAIRNCIAADRAKRAGGT